MQQELCLCISPLTAFMNLLRSPSRLIKLGDTLQEITDFVSHTTFLQQHTMQDDLQGQGRVGRSECLKLKESHYKITVQQELHKNKSYDVRNDHCLLNHEDYGEAHFTLYTFIFSHDKKKIKFMLIRRQQFCYSRRVNHQQTLVTILSKERYKLDKPFSSTLNKPSVQCFSLSPSAQESLRLMPKLCNYGVADFQDYGNKSSISQSTTF